jgi:sulfate adenylyltransferase
MTPASLLASAERAAELRTQAGDWPSWPLTDRQQGELELLVNGGFSPLTGYLGAADHDQVLRRRQLTDGRPWPLPITLDVTAEVADAAQAAGHLGLRDAEGVLLAVVSVSERYTVDLDAELDALYGPGGELADSAGATDQARADSAGPAGATDQARAADPDAAAATDAARRWWRRQRHPDRLAGTVEGVEPATHWSFTDLRLTPAQTRQALGADVDGPHRAGLASPEPPQRVDVMALWHDSALEAGDPAVLVLVLVGGGAGDPLDPHLLVRCWRALGDHLPERAVLAAAPLADAGTGARDEQLRRLVLANYGATPVEPGRGRQDDEGDDEGDDDDRLTPAQLRRHLATGQAWPDEVTYPEVADELRRRYPPLDQRGLTVFMTGFSGSGKSTVAQALAARLADRDARSVALLDGDRVRHHLSSELGFSREHRNLNIRRIGFVAAEITRAGGIAICAPIAPYDEVRRDVRAMVSEAGSFVLVHVATPLEVCEARDRKGLYAKARAGIIGEFTGISDPYEVPLDAELTLDTTDLSVTEAVDRIIASLEDSGHLRPD